MCELLKIEGVHVPAVSYLLLATGMCIWHTAPATKFGAPLAMVVCACFEMRLACRIKRNRHAAGIDIT